MNNRGFTLAEVLITLAIIDVVAALSIPTIAKIYEEHVAAVKAKKPIRRLRRLG